jgi:hypothetical protein
LRSVEGGGFISLRWVRPSMEETSNHTKQPDRGDLVFTAKTQDYATKEESFLFAIVPKTLTTKEELAEWIGSQTLDLNLIPLEFRITNEEGEIVAQGVTE